MNDYFLKNLKIFNTNFKDKILIYLSLYYNQGKFVIINA